MWENTDQNNSEYWAGLISEWSQNGFTTFSLLSYVCREVKIFNEIQNDLNSKTQLNLHTKLPVTFESNSA